MNTTQITLTGDERDDPADTATERESSSNAQMYLAPPDQRGGDGCCPWCLASSETFEQHGDGRPRCEFCDSAIPTETDWYQHDEKIVV